MPNPAESHVSWDDVLELARKVAATNGGDAALAAELARVVLLFQEQTVGSPPASSRITRKPPKP